METEILPPRQAVSASRLTRAEWILLMVLGAIQFTHILDCVLLMPLGPALEIALKINARDFGIMVSVYSFSASLSGLLAAWFIDRFDRKSALLVLYAGFTGATLFCATAPSFGILILGRAAAGGCAGVMMAQVLAIIGDVLPDARRGLGMGVIMSAFSVASILGVPAGLFLANLSTWRTPFVVLGLLSVAVLGLAWACCRRCADIWLIPDVRRLSSGRC